MSTEPKRVGRPALPKDQKAVVTSIRLPPPLNAKLRRIGMAPLISWLKRYKE